MARREDRKLIVGLDIGTSKVVSVVGELADENTLEVIGIGSTRSHGLKRGVVVNIEKRRSDHWQMVWHHVVTVMLVGGSYAYHQTKVGNLIMVLMDTVELFLPVSRLPFAP